MSWTKRVQHPSEVVKKGDAVDVVILNIDGENKRISPRPQAGGGGSVAPHRRDHARSATELRGRVVRLMDKGVVVDLGNDLEGFVPMSQLGVANIDNPGDAVKEGQPARREGASRWIRSTTASWSRSSGTPTNRSSRRSSRTSTSRRRTNSPAGRGGRVAVDMDGRTNSVRPFFVTAPLPTGPPAPPYCFHDRFPETP